ncbi:MAG: hypothetical protein MUC86_00665 [Burkholderiaceae bacterium]|jgi:hypothetical protein|nr:hypothetical protein [Burkholderiaceae bacterium]
MLRRSLLASALGAALATLASGCAPVHAHVAPESARITGPLSEIEIIDRDTGQRLPIYQHQGRRYVAGTPGARYAVAVRNRSGGRVLAVVAVDGINAVSGETAAWQQTGYVLDPGQRYEVRGWRKSQARIAAFEFTALSDSYAARTGRPNDVGVIGVALFREAQRPAPAQTVPLTRQESRLRSNESSDEAAPASPPVPASAAAGTAAPAEKAGSAADLASAEATAPLRLQERLGTGHGRSETSQVSYTDFERARAQPDQVVTIHYDSRANLIALGVIPRPATERPVPNPFPGSLGFVPDPPR